MSVTDKEIFNSSSWLTPEFSRRTRACVQYFDATAMFLCTGGVITPTRWDISPGSAPIIINSAQNMTYNPTSGVIALCPDEADLPSEKLSNMPFDAYDLSIEIGIDSDSGPRDETYELTVSPQYTDDNGVLYSGSALVFSQDNTVQTNTIISRYDESYWPSFAPRFPDTKYDPTSSLFKPDRDELTTMGPLMVQVPSDVKKPVHRIGSLMLRHPRMKTKKISITGKQVVGLSTFNISNLNLYILSGGTSTVTGYMYMRVTVIRRDMRV